MKTSVGITNIRAMAGTNANDAPIAMAIIPNRLCPDSAASSDQEVASCDGVERLDRWLSTYLGAKDTEHSGAVGSRWWLSAVARISAPGATADCCLILEGPQGI